MGRKSQPIFMQGITQILRHESVMFSLTNAEPDLAARRLNEGLIYWPLPLVFGVKAVAFFFNLIPLSKPWGARIYEFLAESRILSPLFGIFRVALLDSVASQKDDR